MNDVLTMEAKCQRFTARSGTTVTLYLGDCRDVLPIEADAVVTDPPYGIPVMLHPKNIHVKSRACVGREYEPIIGNDSEFDPAHLLSLGVCVLFGANHYAHRLPHNGRWLIWDKRCGVQPERNQADAELAWCSEYGAARIFRHIWDGMVKDSERGEARTHPTQKPVALMAWCLDIAKVPIGATVLDPYMGSGTTGIACIRTGRNFIGIELDAKHYATACDRIRRELDGALL